MKWEHTYNFEALGGEHVLRPQKFDLGLAISHNNVLPQEAQDEARALIHIGETELAAIRKSGRDTDSSIRRKVRTQEQQLHDSLRRHRTAIAAHRSLPNETLAEIFEYCVTDDPKILLYKPFTARLDLVCSRWREVALGTGSLWKEVYVDYGDWNDHHLLTKLAQERLVRSGSAPISLNIHGNYKELMPTFVSELVLPFAGRMRSLSIFTTESILASFYALPESVAMENLESIKLSFRREDHGLVPGSVLFSTARNLRRVTLEAFSHPSHLLLPWNQLTELSLATSLHPDVAVSLLRQCPLIVKCEVRLGLTGLLSGERLSTVTMHKLTSLTLSCPDFSANHIDHGRLLQRLSLPHLEFFKLLNISSQMWNSTSTSIITQSHCIETIELFVKISQADMDILLKNTPSLVNLHLRGGDSLPQGLLTQMSRGEIIPKLQTLSCFVDKTPMDAFLDMVECRWRRKCASPCVVLRSVATYVTARALTLTSRERVDRLRVEGMSIMLRRVR